ncbi:MAG: hypothetical protein VBE63_11945 [Lamprobacter sp.]|uniref:hypothetical protein n=1 Tax=Lamprobacter sp. TaxID=3100796 RepID=UPI002B25C015|nr:hypothetical protein [Lamprobacter sp.]MEA3640639.1 hypothetical protein [Lamprobacter sp.]
MNDAEALDLAIGRFAGLVRRIDAQQRRIEVRVKLLYQLLFGAVVVLVASLSYMTVMLSLQLPEATATVTLLNDRFAGIADNMDRMERSVRSIQMEMRVLPELIGHVDSMHGAVAFMSHDMLDIAGAVAQMDSSVEHISSSLTHMRGSFEVMQQTVGGMGRDLNQMSQPMRLFNQMNPLR